MQTLKILMSAYACEPDKGSEPGIGWRWALETAAIGHEVWVITRANNAAGIAKGLAHESENQRSKYLDVKTPLSNLHFIYFDLPPWARWWKRGGFGVHLYYVLWQWGAHLRARALHEQVGFDAVQHITFGVTRHPSFMGRLGIPLILGPLGGGERAPMAARRYYSISGYIKDALRDGLNWITRLDPWVRQMYAQASLILMKTPQSLAWLPSRYHSKAHCMLEVGVDARTQPLPRPAQTDIGPALHLVYVGRFIYWKGMDIGLRAIADLQTRGIPLHLTMIGQGPDQRRWQRLVAHLGLAHCVTWVPWMQQQDLLRAYQSFDALLFPSLHDSSGNVVLEAMASGLPVVCLDLGGPAQLVDSSCGRVVLVKNRSSHEIIKALADALAELASHPVLAAQLRAGARQRTLDFAWDQVVAQVWGKYGSGYKAVIEHATERNIYVSA